MDIALEHPILAAEKNVFKICRPLFSATSLNHFDYERYGFDGYYTGIGLNGELFRTIYNNNLLPSVEELLSNTSHYAFLSPSLLSSDLTIQQDKITKLIVAADNFGISHRLCLIFNTPQYVEIFAFGLAKENKNVVNAFMNQLNLLEKFCVYFREASHDILQQLEESRIIFDDVVDPVLFADIEFKNTHNYSDFLHDIKLKKYNMQGKQGAALLSKREFECLLWTTKDKTAKQVGRLLSLSPRTVEDYLTNAKNKLGCSSKLELVELAHKDRLMKSFID